MEIGNILSLFCISGCLVLAVFFIGAVYVQLTHRRGPPLWLNVVLYLSLQATVGVVLYFAVERAAGDGVSKAVDFLLSLPPFRWLT